MCSIDLQSEFTLPSGKATCLLVTDQGFTIKVESACTAVARRVCADLQKVVERAPVPAAHMAMMQEIQFANYSGTPLACSLSFDLA